MVINLRIDYSTQKRVKLGTGRSPENYFFTSVKISLDRTFDESFKTYELHIKYIKHDFTRKSSMAKVLKINAGF